MRLICALLMACCLLSPMGASAAESSYPNKPIKVIVPFAAGGSSDVAMRIMVPFLEKELGQKIAIVNVEGAAGAMGAMQCFKAPADGYTLLFWHTNILTSYHMGISKIAWDEFTPISNVCNFDLIVTVLADSPYENMQQFIAEAKKRPGKISCSVNIGAGTHFAAIALEQAANFKYHIVSGGGDAKRVTALLGKHQEITNAGAAAVAQYIKTGKLRALGTTGVVRTPGLEEVKTMKELGYDMTMPYYNAFFGPPGLPEEITRKISASVKKICAMPAFAEQLKKIFMYPYYQDTGELQQTLFDFDAQIYKLSRAAKLIPSRL